MVRPRTLRFKVCFDSLQDYYMGIPYSVDMGSIARQSSCSGNDTVTFAMNGDKEIASIDNKRTVRVGCMSWIPYFALVFRWGSTSFGAADLQ